MLEVWLISLNTGSFLKLLLVTGILIICSFTAFHAVINKRESRSALGWFAFIASAPIIGSIFYYFLGLNRIQRKGLRLDTFAQKPKNSDSLPSFNNNEGYESLLNAGDKLSYSPICPINSITPLNTGDEAYPLMLESIESAKKSITLFSYIFRLDRAGEKFVSALVAAHKRGVSVYILVDGVGSSKTLWELREAFKSENIPFSTFLPVLWRPRFANLRNHRKILVIDNKMAFTGGLNIAQDYWPKLSLEDQVLDFHFCFKGEIAKYIQAVFLDDWRFATKEDFIDHLVKEEFSKASASIVENKASNAFGRVITGGPGDNAEKIQWHFVSALNNAKKNIRIISPYFLPSLPVSSALIAASLRGVRVDIIIPEKTDNVVVSWAQEASLIDLLTHDCNIWFSPPPFDHSKLLTIDDDYTSLGSSNWDVRSLRLNFEMNVEVSSRPLAQSLIEVFESKKGESKLYTIEDYTKRKFLVKLRGGFARMLSPYL